MKDPYTDAQKVKSQQQLQQEDDIKQLMSTASGKRFMWRLLSHCGVYTSSYTGDQNTYFNEGRRSVGLFLMAELNSICPEHYIQMMQERLTDEHRNGTA